MLSRCRGCQVSHKKECLTWPLFVPFFKIKFYLLFVLALFMFFVLSFLLFFICDTLISTYIPQGVISEVIISKWNLLSNVFLYSLIWWVYGIWHHFQQYFSYIAVVSFIGVRNCSTRRKTTDLSQATDKLHHIILYRVHERGSNSHFKWW